MILIRAAEADPQLVVASRQCVIVFGEENVRGRATAALLLADYAVMSASARLHIDCAEAWAGAVWRMGREALRMHCEGTIDFDADHAAAIGLVDAITDDPQSLFATRSGLALDAAAMLISRRGGDALERAEFARLFAIGEPQRGLAAFLGKHRPRFEDSKV